jgi:hypothetical protein
MAIGVFAGKTPLFTSYALMAIGVFAGKTRHFTSHALMAVDVFAGKRAILRHTNLRSSFTCRKKFRGRKQNTLQGPRLLVLER